ncbi:hypothetical protein ASF30_11735 [Leifsonia sp. Leaf264]|nr:hypothetical protein ASF30_11735 [Leifsonia sp. Leaf264]
MLIKRRRSKERSASDPRLRESRMQGPWALDVGIGTPLPTVPRRVPVPLTVEALERALEESRWHAMRSPHPAGGLPTCAKCGITWPCTVRTLADAIITEVEPPRWRRWFAWYRT